MNTNRPFFLKRITRISPLYAFTTLAMVPIHLIGTNIYGLSEILFRIVSNLTFTQAWIPLNDSSFNPPAWSVSALMFFFAIFPIVERFIRLLSTNSLLKWVVGLWLSLAVSPLLIALIEQFGVKDPTLLETLKSYFRELPLFRLPQFVLGICAAQIFKRGWADSLLRTQTVRWLTWGLLATIMALTPVNTSWSLLWQYFTVTPLLIVIVLNLAYDQGRWSQWGKTHWGQQGAQASLSLLLIHMPYWTFVLKLYLT